MWDILSKLLNVVLGLLTIYFYIENRKVKGWEIDKNIKLKELEIERIKREFPNKKEALDEEMASRGLAYSGIRNKKNEDLQFEYNNQLNKLSAELEHLKKIKQYKWIFNK